MPCDGFLEICGRVDHFHRQPQNLGIFFQLLHRRNTVGVCGNQSPLEVCLQDKMGSDLCQCRGLADPRCPNKGNDTRAVCPELEPVGELHHLTEIAGQHVYGAGIKAVEIHIGNRYLRGEILAEILAHLLTAQRVLYGHDFLGLIRCHHGGEHRLHLCKLILEQPNPFCRCVGFFLSSHI